MGTEGKNVQSLTNPDLTDFCNGFLSFLWILVGETPHRPRRPAGNETVQEALNIMCEVHPGFEPHLCYLLTV